MDTNPNPTGIKASTVFGKPIPIIQSLPAPVAATELLADPTVLKPPELVFGLLHQGTKGVVASVSKAGKTWLLLVLAVCVANGIKFLHWPTKKGKVLYINFELQKAFIKDRLEVLMKRLQIQSLENLTVWNLRGKTADFEALIQYILKEVEGKGYVLIILDPIYKAMVGRGENMGSSVGVLCNQLERLAERSGAAVVYAHHFPKGDAKKKAVIDRMAGSGVFARDADTIIALTEHSTADCYTVEMVLRNYPDQPPFVVQFEYPVMVVREDLNAEDVKSEEDENVDAD